MSIPNQVIIPHLAIGSYIHITSQERCGKIISVWNSSDGPRKYMVSILGFNQELLDLEYHQLTPLEMIVRNYDRFAVRCMVFDNDDTKLWGRVVGIEEGTGRGMIVWFDARRGYLSDGFSLHRLNEVTQFDLLPLERR